MTSSSYGNEKSVGNSDQECSFITIADRVAPVRAGGMRRSLDSSIARISFDTCEAGRDGPGPRRRPRSLLVNSRAMTRLPVP